MAEEGSPLVQNRSKLKDFLGTIMTMSGDLSNITAPAFVLSPQSVIEIPSFYGQNPSVFVSPASSEDPLRRALLVLRSFLAGLKTQAYLGHSPDEGVKKPLNAFLGEVFLAKWEDENGTTHVVTEQVSHHPPITACRLWNDKHGVVAEGYNRQTVTFNGSVNVQSTGHIVKSLTKYDEHYLLPIPDFKIKGILGTPYPTTSGTYYIPSTNGYTSVIHFASSSFFSSSEKHSFTAHLYKESDGESNPLFTVEGLWDAEWTIRDNKKGEVVETFNVDSDALGARPSMVLDPLEEQDPWESRKAWNDTISALKKGDFKTVTEAKGRLEQGQREMRAEEEKRGTQWRTLFFRRAENDDIVAQLNTKVPDEDFEKSKERSDGIWKFDLEAWKTAQKPYHGSLRPDNTTTEHSTGGDHAAAMGSKQSSERPQQDMSSVRSNETRGSSASSQADPKLGAVEDGRPPEANGVLIDVGRQPEAKEIHGLTKDQPEPQAAQVDVAQEHRGTGIDGMSVDEKTQIENMLREQYSSASRDRRASQSKRHSVRRES